jgi:ABC-type nitrate/sulfonate/bicarbonate transport system substrate-binding protein
MLAGAALALAAPSVLRQSRAQGLAKLTVAVATAPIEPNHHFFLYAKTLGYYREAGIDLTLRSIQGDVNCLRALIAGDTDVANLACYSTLSAANAGARIRNIGAFAPKLDSHIGARRWAQAHPQDAAKISEDFLPDEPKAEISFQLDTYGKNKHWVVDGFLERNYWDYTTAALQRQGLIDRSPKFEDFVVNDFALAARAALKA